ncbi:hypothetical protein [Devosia chinhatensis]|uniref:MBL fold metallo-hydrolase n=1 Tax=Devosia chinhatensis TaxID=429727 RepID=A0A0F5FLA5_9HYPH|nr:hypothetical protein [Devosia chinhatensis]KKB09621.1 hypothetical protein VE26_07010 [Devosia chinhatensis]
MKLTWFGNTTFRIHTGGQIVVVDAGAAPKRIDANELVSGADHVIGLNGNRKVTELPAWKPRPRQRLLDAGEQVRPVEVWSAAPDCLLIDADEDMPLLLIAGSVPQLGRWAEKTVIVIVGQTLAQRVERLVDIALPRLIALAGDDDELDRAFAKLQHKLDGASLIALEPGLAVEV